MKTKTTSKATCPKCELYQGQSCPTCNPGYSKKIDGLLDNRAGQAVRTERAMSALLDAARVGLSMIEEHGLDEMDGKPTHAAKALRAAIAKAEAC